MRISDVMTPAVVSDRSDDTLAQAARRMWEQQTGSLLVVDGDDLRGIITERDILRAVAEGAGKVVGVVSQRDLAGLVAGALNEPETLEQLIESSELVRERRLRRIEHGTWD